jgi:N-acetylglutamate synthase
MRGRVIQVTLADVGRRVTVRSRILASPGEPSMTDAVGILRSWRDGHLLVERRDGSVARIAEADVVAAKVLPDAPSGRSRRTRR